MHPTTTPQVSTPTNATDQDMAEQAKPGHGIPSQDPESSAQSQLEPEDAAREAKSVLIGGGVMAGAATGAAIGIAVAGPVGVLVGASLGAVAGAVGGAMGGAAAGAAANTEEEVETDLTTAGTVHLHIEDTGGDGPAVVLIHGWPLSAQAWEPQVAVLQSTGFRVVTYDRRGFGRSDKPDSSYSYDVLADDLQRVMEQFDLRNATLVGFSMGGGEVARYVARHGESRLHSVVFAASVSPYLMNTADNPEGPLTPEKAQQSQQALKKDRNAFFEAFTQNFFSANGVLKVTESQRNQAMEQCLQSAEHAALACMEAFDTTDFREDLKQVTVPTLVIHGDADAIVPFEGSGQRTHRAVPHSQLVTVSGAPHGLNVSHAQAFNAALLTFLHA